MTTKFGFTKGQIVTIALAGHPHEGQKGEVVGFTAAKVYVQMDRPTLLIRPENLA